MGAPRKSSYSEIILPGLYPNANIEHIKDGMKVASTRVDLQKVSDFAYFIDHQFSNGIVTGLTKIITDVTQDENYKRAVTEQVESVQAEFEAHRTEAETLVDRCKKLQKQFILLKNNPSAAGISQSDFMREYDYLINDAALLTNKQAILKKKIMEQSQAIVRGEGHKEAVKAVEQFVTPINFKK